MLMSVLSFTFSLFVFHSLCFIIFWGVFDVLIFHCLCFLPEGGGRHQQAVHWVNRVDRVRE